jgi:hypothetical protein
LYLAAQTSEFESLIIKGLITELNYKLVAGLDPETNFFEQRQQAVQMPASLLI